MLDTDSLPEVRPYTPGTPLSPASSVALPYPIILSATHKLDYYTQQQAFNLIGMFQNPMMMMMLLGGGLVFAMPYLMVCSLQSGCTVVLTTSIEKYGSRDAEGLRGATRQDFEHSEFVTKR